MRSTANSSPVHVLPGARELLVESVPRTPNFTLHPMRSPFYALATGSATKSAIWKGPFPLRRPRGNARHIGYLAKNNRFQDLALARCWHVNEAVPARGQRLLPSFLGSQVHPITQARHSHCLSTPYGLDDPVRHCQQTRTIFEWLEGTPLYLQLLLDSGVRTDHVGYVRETPTILLEARHSRSRRIFWALGGHLSIEYRGRLRGATGSRTRSRYRSKERIRSSSG